MSIRKYFPGVTALAAIVVAGPSVGSAWAGDDKHDDADTVNDDNDSDDAAMDDGKHLLSKASISFEDAKATARTAVPGATVDEIDLEYVDDKLVFEVDLGGQTVHVDAITGALLKVADDDDAKKDESDD